jgi:hypothetical protein
MKNILEAILYSLLIVLIIISVLFCVVAVLGVPIILSIAYSWWWILTYGCYALVVYVLYNIFIQ